MNDETFEDLVRREAYSIWQYKNNRGIFNTPEINWIEAERKVRKREIEEVLDISVANRLEKYF